MFHSTEKGPSVALCFLQTNSKKRRKRKADITRVTGNSKERNNEQRVPRGHRAESAERAER
jgi:hypothetical protein